MADKAITDLNTIPGSVDDNNTWFAVAQSGTAYKVSGHEFTLALGTILDGHGGIKTIVYTPPVAPSLTGTMVITLADNSTTTVSIQNGKGISSIAKTGTSGDLTDVYTITYNDSTTSTFSVTNGAKGDTGDSWYVWIKYAGSQPTQDSDMGDTPDNWIGIYSGTSSTAPVHYTDYDWFEYKGEKGDTGDAATITTQNVSYQESSSGTVAPSGSWTTTIPTVTPGNFLWTRTQLAFNDGTTVTSYSVSRYGIDGTGAVSTVNNVSPDSNGNVALGASNIPTADNTSVQEHLTNIETDLDNFRPNQLKRRWIFIADSYGHASGTNNGWIDKLVTLLGLTSSDYYESGIGGTGFTTTTYGNFEGMITTLAASISDKNSITDIVVCGGANDMSADASTISAAIKSFNSYCKTTFPNAQIWIGASIASNNSNNIVPQYVRTKEGYANCGIATYLHNLEYVFQNRDLIGSDGIHPTATGYEILSEKIYEALNGGCDVKYRGWHYAFTHSTGDSAESTSEYFSVVVDNGITNIWTTGRVGKIADSSSNYFSVSNGNAITIAYMPSPLFVAPKASLNADYWNCIKCPARAEVRSTINSTWYAVDGYCMITNADEIPSGNTRNALSFVPMDTVVLGTTSAFNSCNQIRVTGLGFTIASELC